MAAAEHAGLLKEIPTETLIFRNGVRDIHLDALSDLAGSRTLKTLTLYSSDFAAVKEMFIELRPDIDLSFFPQPDTPPSRKPLAKAPL